MSLLDNELGRVVLYCGIGAFLWGMDMWLYALITAWCLLAMYFGVKAVNSTIDSLSKYI